LLKQPRWLFVDEASSALDEEAERLLYQRLRELVAAQNGALISIAHRPGVAAFHEQRWQLEADPAMPHGLRVRAC
jgi:vitamin B12/bleomycin/antimicrobial peptide transport system ATP-binding/permease protein